MSSSWLFEGKYKKIITEAEKTMTGLKSSNHAENRINIKKYSEVAQ